MIIDFTKPLICEDRPDIEVLAVYKVNYLNNNFKHAVHVRYNSNSGDESILAIQNNGFVESFEFRLTNKKPTVVKEVWQNVYQSKDGFVFISLCKFANAIECDILIDPIRIAKSVTRTFSDGNITTEFIQIKKD
jgi:hypothetical protein